MRGEAALVVDGGGRRGRRYVGFGSIIGLLKDIRMAEQSMTLSQVWKEEEFGAGEASSISSEE